MLRRENRFERTFERRKAAGCSFRLSPKQAHDQFQISPDQYKHWKLSFDGPAARLSMDVQEDQTLADGYKLKLNSYDLGVDIELADAIQGFVSSIRRYAPSS
jgi:hypothetical protein